MAQTPLTVGSPQQVIDRTLGFREFVGDYQRQLFLIDHAGLPQAVVLEQLEMLGELVVPVLRREFAAVRAPERARCAGASARRRQTARDGWDGGGLSMATPTRSLVAVSAGLGQPSSTRLLADRLVAATERHLRDAGIEAVTEVIELRDHAPDLANNLLTGFPSPALQAAIDRVTDADGLIVASPIFNASYSGLFKMFFDVIEHDSLDGRPVLLAATGGTARHSLALEHALRPLFSYLGADTVRTAVYAASEDWGRAGVPADGTLVQRIDRAAGELSRAMAAREPTPRRDPFTETAPFEQMLRDLEGRPQGG